MKISQLVVFIVIMTSIVIANTGGKVGFSFLKVSVDARATAMGEAYTAVANDASASYWNPAGISMATSNSITAMHNIWLQGSQHNFLAAQLFQGKHNVAFSLNMISINDIELRSKPTLNPEAIASAQNLYLAVSYGTNIINDWHIGAQVKYMYEKYYLTSADGIAFDIGFIKDNAKYAVKYGLSIQNLGIMQKLDKKATSLPTLVRCGVSYILPWSIDTQYPLIAADALYVINDVLRFSLGTEISFLKSFTARVGYVLGSDSYDFTAGLGVDYLPFSFSYAFVPIKYDLGISHRFSINIYFQ